MSRTPWRDMLLHPKKIVVRGYRAASGWRYRASCQCGWSHDAPADYFASIRLNAVSHRHNCRRCL